MTVKEELTERMKSRLRYLFDNSLTTETAKACIELANDYGWADLAREMIVDLGEEQPS